MALKAPALFALCQGVFAVLKNPSDSPLPAKYGGWRELYSTSVAISDLHSFNETLAAELDDSAVGRLSHFLTSIEPVDSLEMDMKEGSKGLEGVKNFRLLPGVFPEDMRYHFDGLASVMLLKFEDGKLKMRVKHFESEAYLHWNSCSLLYAGTGPKVGPHNCMTNPAVNLLPLNSQLWLTIDTAFWGQVDMETLETVESSITAPSLVLNAHPACDPQTGECFVQHGCGSLKNPLSDRVCIGKLETGKGGLNEQTLTEARMPKSKLIQHSHSPCVTPNYVVSKLDNFASRSPKWDQQGMLRFLQQEEDSLWLLMDRRTNESDVISSDLKFVNNHFWNCFEDPQTGALVVDSVAATDTYLDSYFAHRLGKGSPDWPSIFKPAQRCVLKEEEAQSAFELSGDSQGEDSTARFACEQLVKDDAQTGQPVYFDYPTFNPLWKMKANYRWFYAIAAKDPTAETGSRWFDQLVKVDVQSREVSASWSEEGTFLTEADFVVKNTDDEGEGGEDDGWLLSVAYREKENQSSLLVFDARTLTLIDEYPLGQIVPFHAHGVVCKGERCFTNP
uniref:Uncharacterized protein n=1 Tax=Chromera velia CCMP2878 TaxID=1169474 RepID=A0A0G4IB33_9ALVE|eukprot:Cvel_12738.t1-p1 / transcript=Cvel_12738.t1 / gene=Cvel_12738 / organism=Chromera_velia_CCMP2878 / gene_product=Beta,beta-carotene 9',10'-oxygenase, putative / transcript_product=Beta,beta-carotene 9',10'-oxygenase, putative / location=Cvel_scaffold846:48748-51816(-) / protein_length=560 / sequence_SO=supercontig / SO=protein_coding / is_pseudo=false